MTFARLLNRKVGWKQLAELFTDLFRLHLGTCPDANTQFVGGMENGCDRSKLGSSVWKAKREWWIGCVIQFWKNSKNCIKKCERRNTGFWTNYGDFQSDVNMFAIVKSYRLFFIFAAIMQSTLESNLGMCNNMLACELLKPYGQNARRDDCVHVFQN